MAVTNGWGKGAQNNTNGWGKSGTNNIGYGAIYESSAAGDTSIIGTSAAFLYSKSSFNQGEADPTPTITGTTGGSFNASANVVFVDTGTFNSSTGQIDLSATSIGSHIITYTVNGVQSGQTVGVTAVPYASTSSFTFDGVNDYFDLGNGLLTDLGSSYNNPITISSWIKTTNFTKGGGAGIFQIGNLTNYGFISAVLASNKLNIYTRNTTGGSPTTAISSDISSAWSGNWINLVIIWDTGNSSNSKVYANGSPLTLPTNNWASVTAPAGINFSNQNSFIGLYYNDSYTFDGNMDEFSIWNTALSQSAVTEIYNSGAPNDLTSLSNASNTNLKAWYKF